MHPTERSVFNHIFAVYQHQGSDAEGSLQAVRAFQKEQLARNLAGEFVVTAIPYAPKGACCFEEFEYAVEPYDVRACLLSCSLPAGYMSDHAD